MKRQLTILLFCLALTGIFAQWSTDPQSPNLIAGFTGEQVIPKVAVTDSGNTYICRFDNSSGAYKVWLNLLSPQGTPLWTNPEGMLVSEHTSMTWLTDYDMTADNDGNAVIVFQDIRNAGVNNVFAYKIAPNGTFLWGADGIPMSADTNTELSNMSPTVFNSIDNSTYVAWQHMGTTTSVMINCISPEGQKLWGENGITIAPMTGSYTWPQIIQGDTDNILLKYYQDTGPFWAPNRFVYVARYNNAGQRLWNSLMTDAGGLAAWQQIIPFESDGAGGALLAWYEDRENDMDQDVYVQRVNSAGTITMPEDGALITQDTVNQQYYPRLAVDSLNQQVYAFFRVTDANQNLCGIGRQLLDFTGTRLWGDTAPLIVEISSEQADMIGAYYTQSGAVCVYEYGADNIYATCWRSSGNQGWQAGATILASTSDTKYHYDMDTYPGQWMVLAWEQGMSDMDVYAMRLNPNGTLGMQYLPPRDLAAYLVPPDGVQLNWQAPTQYMIPDDYQVYMDGDLAQVVTGEFLTYTFMGLSVGEHEFYVKARYGENYSEPSASVTVSIVSNDDEIIPPLLSDMIVSPNPFRGSATLTFNLTKPASNGIISVFNLKGQKIAQHIFSGVAGTNSYTLGTDLLPVSDSGIYFIRLDVNGFSRTTKAILID